MADFVADAATSKPGKTVAVIGAGWAGCAAAVELSRAGHQVTLFEAARTLGGRARRVDIDGRALDNGQHILLGAYTETLRLLRLVGHDPRQVLLNLPLQMRYPTDSDGMDFVAPRWPAPLHLVAALLRAKGLARADKMALARFSSSARWMGWHLHVDCSVTELLERFDQTPRLIDLMWRPLCLAALNTPPERASAKVFLNVLRDSLGAKKRRASDMLLPKIDLSALFPDAAAAYVRQHGGTVRTGAKVGALQRQDGLWRLTLRAEHDGTGLFDAVVVATPASQAAVLLNPLLNSLSPPLLNSPSAEPVATLVAQLTAFDNEAITTCYLQYDASVRLDLPFFALRDNPKQFEWGQFVFDRGQLDSAQAGLLAVVISASGPAAQQDQALLAEAVAVQLAAAFQRVELGQPGWFQVITEKRATFACAPGLSRPGNLTALPGLLLAGDYTASDEVGKNDVSNDYPATLEAAVRSGVAAARHISAASPA